jgi:hypothetical protein
MKMFLAFIVLQIADLGTTIEVISMGGEEKNPIVGHLMGLGDYEGLAVAKLIAIAIGGFAAFSGRYNGLRRMNIAFMAVVAWNLSIIGRLMLA